MIHTTIAFRLAGVRLLIKDSFYLRAALLLLEWYLPLPSIKKVAQKTQLRGLHFKLSRYDRKISTHTDVEPSKGRLLPCFCLELRTVHSLRSWPCPLNCARACVWLLFLPAELQVQLLFILARTNDCSLLAIVAKFRLIFEQIWYYLSTYCYKRMRLLARLYSNYQDMIEK